MEVKKSDLPSELQSQLQTALTDIGHQALDILPNLGAEVTSTVGIERLIAANSQLTQVLRKIAEHQTNNESYDADKMMLPIPKNLGSDSNIHIKGYNALIKYASVESYGDLIFYGENGLRQWRNIGDKGIEIIRGVLSDQGLELPQSW